MRDRSEEKIDNARHMLSEIGRMAEEASLTGGLNGGASRLAEFYNQVLAQVQEEGRVNSPIFQPVDPATAEYARLAVDAHMLSAGLGGGPRERRSGRDDAEGDDNILPALAPFIGSEELGLLVKEKLRSGAQVKDHILMAIAPFLDSGMLGDLVRMRSERPSPPPQAPEPPEAPPAPPTDLAPVGTASERIYELAAQLQRGELTDEQREAILIQIRRVSLTGE